MRATEEAMGGMRAAGRVAAWVIVFFALAVAMPNEAAANIGKCRSPALLPGDESQVIAAARKVLPPDREPAISNRCLLQDQAFAEITTEAIRRAGGMRDWWVTDCQRKSQGWRCDEAQFEQESEQRLIVDGIERHVAITSDSSTELESARLLATRALRLYSDPDSMLPYCGGIKGEESRWQAARKQHPLSASEPIRLTVRSPPSVPSAPPTIGSVLFDEIIQPEDFQFRIQLLGLGPDKPDPWYPCWQAMAP